ncbi:MAG: nitrogenase component 1 [Rhodoferax sp.]
MYRSNFRGKVDSSGRDSPLVANRGGKKRLFKSIREIIEKYDPPAVFVYQTCVTALVGDDIEAVCQRATEMKLTDL